MMSPTPLDTAWKLHESGRLDEAEALYRQILERRPDHADAWCLFGILCRDRDRATEAVDAFREALNHDPRHIASINNLGNVLVDLGEYEEARDCFEQVLQIQPDLREGHNGLGAVYLKLGQLSEALACFQRAAGPEAALPAPPVQPVFPVDIAKTAEAHKNSAVAWLLMGQLEQGWPEFEWRWQCREFTPRGFRQPLWDGSPLDGKTILLHAEQGLGDTIHFVRYAPLVKARGGTVVLECQRHLLPLMQTALGIDRLMARGDPLPPFDVHAPLLSLPGIFKTTMATIPASVPYLFADAAIVERWRGILDTIGGYKIGIAWQGDPRHYGDQHRSMPLASFAPVARVPGVRLVSVQKGAGSEQLALHAEEMRILDFSGQLDVTSGPFMDTAAIMKLLDLVITTDTSIAHLAGALGVPTWVALPATPHWTWMLERGDTPWYPSMRLFRQSKRGEWSDVFESMARELSQHVPACPADGTSDWLPVLESAAAALSPSKTRVTQPASCYVSVSPGELLDRLAILELKNQHVTDPQQRRNIRTELAQLRAARIRHVAPAPDIDELIAELLSVNQTLWAAEDEIRAGGARTDFGPRFIDLARLIYRTNDRRAEIKKAINERLGSPLVEEKSYRRATCESPTRPQLHE